MTVLVAIPYYRTPALVERAVRSVLAQTHRDLVCVVIGDGERPPISWTHPRLVIHSYAENRGAYFAQDVAIFASPFEWYAPVASDDWLDPDHIERMVAAGIDQACGALWAHGDGPDYCGPDHDDHARCRGVLVEKAYEVGMYRTSRYLEIGGHNPAERIGQDSLTLRVMRLVAPVGATRVPTYNRRYREGSLCTAPETKNGSPARTEMRVRNRAIVARCEQIVASPPARGNRELRAARIRAYRRGLVPAEIWQAVEREAAALREQLVPLAAAA